jgi:catechol 2,3-dioxygenase-like lactoylglutathione lyase family enzyme
LTAVLALQFPALPAAAQSEAQPGEVGFNIRIDHVGISVADLEESVDWYVSMLAFELVRPINRNPGSAMTIAQIRRGDFNIALMEELESKGVEIVLRPREGGATAFFFVSDNSGNTFEFIQRR